MPHSKSESGKHTLYEDQSVEVVEFIRKQQQKGKRGDEIKAELEKKFGSVVDGEGEQANTPQTTNKQQSNGVLATINAQGVLATREFTRTIGSQLKTIHRQNNLLDVKDKEIERLEEEIGREKQEKKRLEQELISEQRDVERLEKELEKMKSGGVIKRVFG